VALTLTSLDTRYDAPDEATIARVLASLDGGRNILVTLGPSEATYVQASGSVASGFVLDYQDGSLDRHYRSNAEDLSLDRVTQVFHKFARGDDSWRTDVAWQHVPHVEPEIPWYNTWVGYVLILLAVIAVIWYWRS
jgi:hypothetical protein